MNKKNLSVVLAGAMLATSVAPVLADTTTAKEYSVDDKALLENELVSVMKTKLITSNKMLSADNNKDGNANEFVADAIETEIAGNAAGTTETSAYGVRLLDEKGKEVGTVVYDTKAINTLLAGAKEGYTVELVERETNEFYGETVPGSKIEKDTSVITYSDSELADVTTTNTNLYKEIVIGTPGTTEGTNNVLLSTTPLTTAKVDGKNVVTVNTTKLKDSAANGKYVTITLDSKSNRIDGRLPLTADGKLLDYTKKADINKFDHFDTLTKWTPAEVSKKDAEVKDTYKLTAASANENLIKASDLYDGLALTAKGTEIAADIANAKESVLTAKKELVKIDTMPAAPSTGTELPVYKFTVKYYKNEGDIDKIKPYKTLTVYSSNYKELKSVHSMLSGTSSYEVGIIGGANRYATAVNVAKANSTTVADGEDIILVNGDSLVDGLSAAPLAAFLGNKAPVLLSKANSLPNETKEYIKELTKRVTNKKTVTINLVGGESVLSTSLVKELEDMGFYVKRFGGDNREATSLAVAKAVASKSDKTNNAFVVGGNGEADAMAISAVATRTGKVAPIIVSSVHGLSDEALEFLGEKSAKGDVTIVGGESVVSKFEEEAINDSLSLNKASRIAGDNRFETNAKIIEEYYKDLSTAGVGAVVVTKDGVAKKSELVDALAAANYAAANNAPIVLATDSLSDVQKDALLKMDIDATGKSIKLAVQVGEGVERSVLETVAGLFGLSNR